MLPNLPILLMLSQLQPLPTKRDHAISCLHVFMHTLIPLPGIPFPDAFHRKYNSHFKLSTCLRREGGNDEYGCKHSETLTSTWMGYRKAEAWNPLMLELQGRGLYRLSCRISSFMGRKPRTKKGIDWCPTYQTTGGKSGTRTQDT